MKKITMVLTGLFLASGISVMAAFTNPTEQQLSAAANDPAQVATLLQGASSEQAAQVMKAIIVKILGAGLSSQASNAKITAIVSGGFAAIPAGTAPAVAAALGTACGSSVAISAVPTVVSTIQNAVVTAGGSSGSNLGEAFGAAYTEAKEAAASNTNNKDGAPPVTNGYEAQQPKTE